MLPPDSDLTSLSSSSQALIHRLALLYKEDSDLSATLRKQQLLKRKRKSGGGKSLMAETRSLLKDCRGRKDELEAEIESKIPNFKALLDAYVLPEEPGAESTEETAITTPGFSGIQDDANDGPIDFKHNGGTDGRETPLDDHQAPLDGRDTQLVPGGMDIDSFPPSSSTNDPSRGMTIHPLPTPLSATPLFPSQLEGDVPSPRSELGKRTRRDSGRAPTSCEAVVRSPASKHGRHVDKTGDVTRFSTSPTPQIPSNNASISLTSRVQPTPMLPEYIDISDDEASIPSRPPIDLLVVKREVASDDEVLVKARLKAERRARRKAARVKDSGGSDGGGIDDEALLKAQRKAERKAKKKAATEEERAAMREERKERKERKKAKREEKERVQMEEEAKLEAARLERERNRREQEAMVKQEKKKKKGKESHPIVSSSRNAIASSSNNAIASSSKNTIPSSFTDRIPSPLLRWGSSADDSDGDGYYSDVYRKRRRQDDDGEDEVDDDEEDDEVDVPNRKGKGKQTVFTKAAGKMKKDNSDELDKKPRPTKKAAASGKMKKKDEEDGRFRGHLDEGSKARQAQSAALYQRYIGAHSLMFRTFNPGDSHQDEVYRRAAGLAIKVFDRAINPEESVPLPHELRRTLREQQSMLPAAACTSRELTLHILQSKKGNTWCIYHWPRPKRSFRPTSLFHVTGFQDDDDSLGCGCSPETACLEFIMYKTWYATQGGHTEPVTLFDPRQREFIVQNFFRWSSLTLDDLYNPEADGFGTGEHYLLLMRAQRDRADGKMRGIKEELSKEDIPFFDSDVEQEDDNPAA